MFDNVKLSNASICASMVCQGRRAGHHHSSIQDHRLKGRRSSHEAVWVVLDCSQQVKEREEIILFYLELLKICLSSGPPSSRKMLANWKEVYQDGGGLQGLQRDAEGTMLVQLEEVCINPV